MHKVCSNKKKKSWEGTYNGLTMPKNHIKLAEKKIEDYRVIQKKSLGQSDIFLLRT